MQFHGTADRYALAGASNGRDAVLRRDAPPPPPRRDAAQRRRRRRAGRRVHLRPRALGRHTRQGNPAWAGQELDGQIDPIRSDDLFFPNWLDFNKVAIPQADEQQRLLANLITQMNLDRTPLPRFWYLPRGEKAAVVHDRRRPRHGTARPGQFSTSWRTARAAARWPTGSACARPPTSSRDAPLTDAEAAHYQAAGFEIALHLELGTAGGLQQLHLGVELDGDLDTQLADFASAWPSLDAPVDQPDPLHRVERLGERAQGRAQPRRSGSTRTTTTGPRAG